TEETGFATPSSAEAYRDLGTIKQSGGKLVSVWAFEGDCDPSALVSNMFQMEWPPRSGRQSQFPEVDRGGWFSIAKARELILASQQSILDILLKKLNATE